MPQRTCPAERTDSRRAKYAARTPEQRVSRAAENASRYAARTPEWRAARAAESATKWAARTPEQVERDRLARRKSRSARTPEQVERDRAKSKARRMKPEAKAARHVQRVLNYAQRTSDQKEEDAAYMRAYHAGRSPAGVAARRLRSRALHLRREYNLTPEQHDAMYTRQNGLCASCEMRPAWGVDHDHYSGALRELLCHQCNVAEGLLGGLAGARRLVAYLERHVENR
jgi:hypothetical protein